MQRAIQLVPPVIRNVKGFKRHHKRIHRIHREQALNLRIKPRKRLVRACHWPFVAGPGNGAETVGLAMLRIEW